MHMYLMKILVYFGLEDALHAWSVIVYSASFSRTLSKGIHRYVSYKYHGAHRELSDKELVSEVEKRMAQLTDSVIILLSSKSYLEIASYEGKEQMRHELVIRMNSFLETGSIERLYFTEFVMQ